MVRSPDLKAKFNFEHASVMLLDENPLSLNILLQVLTGFGAKHFTRCTDIAKAEDEIAKTHFDLIIVDATGPSTTGTKFVSWLRRSGIEPNCYAPVLLTSGHTAQNSVLEARDCGAHFIIAKPLTPLIVLERIIWIAKEGRKFLESDAYVGPDRRFKNVGVPTGMEGRRRDDLSIEAEESETPIMEQDVIETSVQAQKVAQ